MNKNELELFRNLNCELHNAKNFNFIWNQIVKQLGLYCQSKVELQLNQQVSQKMDSILHKNLWINLGWKLWIQWNNLLRTKTWKQTEHEIYLMFQNQFENQLENELRRKFEREFKD